VRPAVLEVPPVIDGPEEAPPATSQRECAPPRAVRPPVVTPLSPERYKVQVTISKETYDRLRRVQDLMRHTIPNGDPSAIFDRAVSLLLSELERTKLAAAKRPRTTAATSTVSRQIPAAVKRGVWTRDGGRCAFVGNKGRCTETGFLEFHHLVPYAGGGETSVENLELRCRPHNAYEAEGYFSAEGPLFVRERPSHRWTGSRLVPERAVSSGLAAPNSASDRPS
jgi:5-methylcytosine-specific restriction endonuclease McrA